MFEAKMADSIFTSESREGHINPRSWVEVWLAIVLCIEFIIVASQASDALFAVKFTREMLKFAVQP